MEWKESKVKVYMKGYKAILGIGGTGEIGIGYYKDVKPQ